MGSCEEGPPPFIPPHKGERVRGRSALPFGGPPGLKVARDGREGDGRIFVKGTPTLYPSPQGGGSSSAWCFVL